MECESKSGTSNNTENSTQFKIIQIIPDQHTRKARNQGTTKKGHTGHCKHTSKGTDVQIQNIQHGNNITCSKHCKHRIAATLYTLETWFYSSV